MSQNNQSFLYSLSHASLECPPRCGSLYHLANVADVISRGTFVDDHMHIRKVRVTRKKPQGSNEECGLVIPQCQEQCRWDSIGTAFLRGGA
jgi:hypothetical protein